MGSIEENAFVIRSGIGAVVKEGDNELIFWVQDLTSMKSISGAKISVYNLLEKKQLSKTLYTGSDGIAKASMLSSDDIALVKNGNDVALLLVNLDYLLVL